MITLRKAELGDINLLYKWANDAVVRKNSFNTEPIPYANHQKWFKRIMMDDSVHQYILMDGDIPVGQIRLNVDGIDAEIGYSIAKEYRGKGYGHKILNLVVDEVQKRHPEIHTLTAKVKPDNVASTKLFESEGYNKRYSCYVMELAQNDN